jgi:hypothetical protein
MTATSIKFTPLAAEPAVRTRARSTRRRFADLRLAHALEVMTDCMLLVGFLALAILV